MESSRASAEASASVSTVAPRTLAWDDQQKHAHRVLGSCFSTKRKQSCSHVVSDLAQQSRNGALSEATGLCRRPLAGLWGC